MFVVVFVLLLCQINAEVYQYKTVKSELIGLKIRKKKCLSDGQADFKITCPCKNALSDSNHDVLIRSKLGVIAEVQL